MGKRPVIFGSVYILLLTTIANSYLAIVRQPGLLWGLIPVFLLLNIFTGFFQLPAGSKRLKICYHGALLLVVFIVSAVLSGVIHIVLAFRLIPGDWKSFLWSAVYCICALAIVFWNGILCVYLTSWQLGLKQRLKGIFCGMIPIANLIALNGIIRTTLKEVDTEVSRELMDRKRASEQLCSTKYPLVFIHGVFFRDSKKFNYWGRIPETLERNGATVFYGNHQSAASVRDSAAELTQRIKDIVRETGCEKVNIIAHSKGGLDCRCALHELDMAPYVASLTTVNTPHRGCVFADELLGHISDNIQFTVATAYNIALKKLGDPNPNFLTAVNDLTASFCEEADKRWTAPDGIYCQSIGSVLPKGSNTIFPLSLSYHIVEHFDGPNDGLVRETAFAWGEKYTLLAPAGSEGISHADIIDLTRQDIEGFDVREFYVELINDLKSRGL